jgi:hypothetical protein
VRNISWQYTADPPFPAPFCQTEPPEPECTSLTAAVEVPGLRLIEVRSWADVCTEVYVCSAKSLGRA